MERLQLENQRLGDRLKELQAEILHLQQNVEQAEEQVRIRDEQLQAKSSSTTFLDYEQLIQVRSSVLEALRKGKGRGRGSGGIATTSPQYRTAVKVLDEFITGISGVLKKGQPEVVLEQESTPSSILATNMPESQA